MAPSDVMASLRARLLGDRHRYVPLPPEQEGDRNGLDVEAAATPRPPSPSPSPSPSPRKRERQRRPPAGSSRHRRLLRLIITAIMFLMVLVATAAYSRLTACRDLIECGRNHGSSRLWGQYSPYFSISSDISTAVPRGCRLTFAQVLSRHGARDPTAGKTVAYNATIARIQASASRYGPGHEFLREYSYRLGADELTAFGERQMRDSGRDAFRRYRILARAEGGGADSGSAPFVRASGQNRVVSSAIHWSRGFFASPGRRGGGGGGRKGDDAVLIIPEADGVNNTLSHGLCPAFEKSTEGADAQKAWADRFLPPITARLGANLVGADVTAQDAIHLMDMCPFDSVADPAGHISPFCALFTQDEWHSYDYYQSLGKYYGYGPGSPLGPTQGVGFVNELVARLTGQPVADQTSSNTTLDQSPATFPLDRVLYADFSHDNDMTGMFAALGLYNTSLARLPADERRAPADADGYSAAWTVPFAARMYVEKMVCRRWAGGAAEGDEEELVRVLVNDRVVPLRGCGADGRGRCRLSSFVESLGFARAGGRWGACFEKASAAVPS